MARGRYLPATAQRLAVSGDPGRCGSDGWCVTSSFMVSLPSCWASGGVPNRSPTNCRCGSLTSASVTCARSRSTRRSTTPDRCDPPGQAAPPAAPTPPVQGLERRGRLTSMTMIADRPAEVDDRVQVGHWEGDCIMGAGNRSAIGTLVERVTRFVILVHVSAGRPTAEAMRDGIADALGALARRPAADTDLGSGQGTGAAPADHCPASAPACTSATRTRRGSGAATRTRTVCCATTFPRAPT